MNKRTKRTKGKVEHDDADEDPSSFGEKISDEVIAGTCFSNGGTLVTESDIEAMAADLDLDERKALITLSLLLLQVECLRTVKAREPLCEEAMALWAVVFAPYGIEPVNPDNVSEEDYEKFLFQLNAAQSNDFATQGASDMTQDAFDAAISAAIKALETRSDNDSRADCERAVRVFQHVIACIDQNRRDDAFARVHPEHPTKNRQGAMT
jgi:hypothetical protein